MDIIDAMSRGLIDLHTHTTCSDGSASPTAVIEAAAHAGARAVAITDHDTIAGLAEGASAAQRLGIEFIDGVEISAEYSPGTMHLLGYCVDPSSAALNGALDELRNARARRNPQIAARLQDLGMEVRYEEVAALAGNQVVGRPHFAKVLLQKRYVASIQDAFDRFLAKGGAAYVEKKRLSPEDSIGVIHSAGGVAVLAHPYQMKLPALEDLDEKLAYLAGLGLDGVEAIYSRHSDSQRAAYAKLADKYGLFVSGGSDFHGSYKPDIAVVTGLGNLAVPYELLDEIRSRAAARAAVIVN